MAYTAVTVEQFQTRFPNLAETDEEVIQACLDEAALSVDDSWVSQSNYTAGVLYLAAHLVATDNSAEGTAVVYGGAGAGGVASESFGGMSISYDKGSSAASDAAANSQWGSTEYGRRFYRLLRQNKPAIVSI